MNSHKSPYTSPFSPNPSLMPAALPCPSPFSPQHCVCPLVAYDHNTLRWYPTQHHAHAVARPETSGVMGPPHANPIQRWNRAMSPTEDTLRCVVIATGWCLVWKIGEIIDKSQYILFKVPSVIFNIICGEDFLLFYFPCNV